MKLFHKLLLPAILLPLFSFAQGNYKPGFVITSKGDTLKGYIDYREWGNNPSDINFRSSLDKQSTKIFTVNDIDYFEITRYTAYKRFSTSISLNETNIQRLQYERDTSVRNDNIFLKVEQKGKNVTLYSYNDKLKERFYINDNRNNILAELIYRIYYVPNEKNNVTTVSQNVYRQQLLILAQKYNVYSDDLRYLVQEANYERSELADICHKINNTTKANQATKTDQDDDNVPDKKYIRFFAGAGVGFNTINRTGTSSLYNSPSSHSSVDPRLSVGLNFYPSPDVGRFILKLEFAYTSASFKSTGTLYFYDPTKISTYNFGQHTFSFIPQFQYSIYNTDAFKFYISPGVSINFSQYSNNSVYNPVTKETEENFADLNSHWLSIPLKAGIVLNKKMDIFLSYFLTTPISDNAIGLHEDFSTYKLSTVQAGVSYIF